MYRKRFINKGYILIYSLLICSLCMLIAIYLFNMQIRKIKNISSYKNYIVTNKKYNEYKEKLFTLFYENITTNVQEKSEDSIRNYLQGKCINYVTEDAKAKIEYDEILDKIIFKTFFETNYLRHDIYDYTVDANKFKFKYNKTLYMKGKIE